MPDWSYHPFSRPILFQLPAERARDLTLHAIRTLAALPFGKTVIHIMGHMDAPKNIARSALGMDFASPVGLGAGLDSGAVASGALSQFGFGFLEVGAVTLQPIMSNEKIERDTKAWTITYPDLPVNAGVEKLVQRLQKYKNLSARIGVRLGYQPGSSAIEAAIERRQLIERLTPFADFFVLGCQHELADGAWTFDEWEHHLRSLTDSPRPLLIHIPPDLDPEIIHRMIDRALRLGISGVVIGGSVRDGNRRISGRPTRELSLRLVANLRARYGDTLTIIASGGIFQPQDALDFLAAGADLIQLHSGLVYSGPGLPKRINEALAYYCAPEKTPIKPIPLLRAAWFWMTILGAALAISGIVVWFVALTYTVLPYDEAFVGLSRAEMAAINPNLLPFLTHDRVTLAGTMFSTGILYLGLALGGVRRGMRWAKNAISISALIGFASFFLFLGFGYFDPIHAVLSGGLLPIFLVGAWGKVGDYVSPVPPNRTNNRRWFNGQWGQIGFVTIGAGLMLAGIAITTVGLIRVFVPEDLLFLNTTPEVLNAANAKLLPLIAHDRVGFGGNLISTGASVLLLSLWGFRQGERWVWWTLALGGLPGFIAGIGIHLSVGYLNLLHLMPALVALVLFVFGLIFTFPYLHYPESTVSTG
jgi:dihydroorotate dehydrogenase